MDKILQTQTSNTQQNLNIESIFIDNDLRLNSKSIGQNFTKSSFQYFKLIPHIFKIQSEYLPLLPIWNYSELQKQKINCSNKTVSETINLDQLRKNNSQYSQQTSQEELGGSQDNTKKTCNCKKSKCLKQYCDCFASGQECGKNCQCQGCYNQLEFNEIRDQAMQMILNRDSKAFSSKIEEIQAKRTHNRGCNCRKSGCTKKYCECYQAGTSCGSLCKCSGCQNCETDINPFKMEEPLRKQICVKY